MIVEGQDPTPVDTIVEVDEITFPVDLDNAIQDESGKVIQAKDDKGVTHRVKGKTNPLEPEVKVDPKPADELKPTDTPEAKIAAEEAAKKAKEESKEPEYLNQADYVLKSLGYKHEEIDLGGDIGKVKIADLTAEQQRDVIVTEFENTIEEYQNKIEELEARKPELKFDDPAAQQIVDFLKEGGDIKKLAKEILSRDPAAQAKMMSDDDIVKAQIKKEYPSFTDEDIADEIKDLKPEQIARRAKALRAKMETEKPSFEHLTAEQKQLNAQNELNLIKEFETESTTVKETVKKLKDIAGVPINDEVRNYLLSKVIPKDKDSDSAFVTNLASNPERLVRLEFLDTYFERIVENTKKTYYEMGLKKGNVGKEKLSDEPIKTYQGKQTGKAKEVIVDVMDPKFKFDEFISNGQQF